jgi:nicotinate-nucleotide adenylyltransferase
LRIGILGGTFDPIHLGHLRMAEEVGEELSLERVYLVPSAYPPHKDKKPVTPFPHRFAMTRLAAAESPLLEVTDMEGRRPGLSYSIETLKEFQGLYSADLELHFIVGMDAFLEIESWRDYTRLFDYAHFVVIQRPGAPLDRLEPFLRSLEVGFREGPVQGTFVAPSGNLLVPLEATLLEISSTKIRQRVAEGKSIRFLVTDAVRSYIVEEGLYRGNDFT